MPANMFLLVAGGAFRGVGDAKANFINGSVIWMFPMNLIDSLTA